MNVEDALLLLDRLCENDNENQTVEQVNPVIEFPPIYPELDMQNEDYIDKEGNMIEDVNNNEDLNHIYGSIDQVTIPINSDIEDPDYTVNENSGGSSGTDSEDHLLKPKEHNPSFHRKQGGASPTVSNDGLSSEKVGEVNASITDESECEQEMTQPRSRKRVRCYENWKQNIRKRKRQAGEEYTIVKGNTQPQRKIKITKDCHGQCKFSCAKKFSKDEQESIFNDFWKLTDIEKAHFYSITTERNQKKRKRTNNEHSRKNFSFRYFFNKDEVKSRVCKKFYLGTLDISQKRVANYHKKAAQNVFIDRRGVHTKRSIPEETKAYIREHINSFPRMPSHYCRSNTKKEYLEAELTLARMYNLYVEKCQEKISCPCKVSFIQKNIQH